MKVKTTYEPSTYEAVSYLHYKERNFGGEGLLNFTNYFSCFEWGRV